MALIENGNSKIIIGVLLFMLTFVGGWEASSYEQQKNVRETTDIEIDRRMSPQIATMNQKLNDIQNELGQIAEYSVKR